MFNRFEEFSGPRISKEEYCRVLSAAFNDELISEERKEVLLKLDAGFGIKEIENLRERERAIIFRYV